MTRSIFGNLVGLGALVAAHFSMVWGGPYSSLFLLGMSAGGFIMGIVFFLKDGE